MKADAQDDIQADVETARSARTRTRRVTLVVIALAAAAGALGAKLALGLASDRVVARTDEITLKQEDIESLLADLDPAARSRLLQDTPALTTLVRRELGRRVLQQQALAQGWDRREDVQEKLERLRIDFIATSYLEAQAAPPASFPSDSEIETAYQLNQQRFLIPRQFHLAQIYLRRPSDAKQVESARAGAKALADDLRKRPAAFAETAKSKSDNAATATQGGDVGWLREDQIQPAIRAVAIGLSTGEVSEPVEGADGWHILRLIETKPAGVAPLTQVREALVATLRQQRAQEMAAAYVTKLLTEKQAVVDEITLAKVQKDLQ